MFQVLEVRTRSSKLIPTASAGEQAARLATAIWLYLPLENQADTKFLSRTKTTFATTFASIFAALTQVVHTCITEKFDSMLDRSFGMI